MGVPRHLQVPLSIDTNISYSLDKSMFPGLDDPRYKHEPVLMIAPDIPDFRHAPKTKEIPKYQGYQRAKMGTVPAESTGGYQTELFGDLLEIMDISTQDLILGLRNTDDYLSLVEDVVHGLPHSDELQYIDGPLGRTHNSHQTQIRHLDRHSVNSCASKYSIVSNKCHTPICIQTNTDYSDHGNRECQLKCWWKGGHSGNNYASKYASVSDKCHALLSVQTNTDCSDLGNSGRQPQCWLKGGHSGNSCVSNNYCVTEGHPVRNSSLHQSFQSLCVNNTVSSKRKRDADSSSDSFSKRPCYVNGQIEQVIQYQNSWRRYGNGFNGIIHGNPVRVV